MKMVLLCKKNCLLLNHMYRSTMSTARKERISSSVMPWTCREHSEGGGGGKRERERESESE